MMCIRWISRDGPMTATSCPARCGSRLPGGGDSRTGGIDLADVDHLDDRGRPVRGGLGEGGLDDGGHLPPPVVVDGDVGAPPPPVVVPAARLPPGPKPRRTTTCSPSERPDLISIMPFDVVPVVTVRSLVFVVEPSVPTSTVVVPSVAVVTARWAPARRHRSHWSRSWRDGGAHEELVGRAGERDRDRERRHARAGVGHGATSETEPVAVAPAAPVALERAEAALLDALPFAVPVVPVAPPAPGTAPP